MNHIKHCWIFFALCLFSMNSYSQSLLVIEKRYADVKNLKYKVGDKIFLKMNNKEKTNGYITKMNDTSIVVNYTTINLKDVHTVYTERKLLMIFSEIGIKAGAAFFIIDTFNNLANNDGPTFSPGAVKTGGLMIGTGLILYPFIYKKHEITENKWRVKVLQYYNQLEPKLN